jgi:hypothetical protein
MIGQRKLKISFAAVSALCLLGCKGALAQPGALPDGKPSDTPCPTLSLGPDVQVLEIASTGQAERRETVAPPVYGITGSRCYYCLEPTYLKSVRIDQKGDVFLVLVGSHDLYWKPVAADGTRIVGVLTLNTERVKTYRPNGILSDTQLTPVAQMSAQDFTRACQLKSSDYLALDLKLGSHRWTADAVRAVVGRGPDSVVRD